uniref:ATP synthase complex subunit 8 n=1 Tax=Cyamus boopis TaxID=335540 RepID=Q4FBI7_CYABO|nr:ATPase 8 [Cyamus boopis]UCP07191.1 ATP synthase F0 subunit 8 [Cyamus boopis]
MPQMAPLMWSTLMMMTIVSLLTITIYVYFNKTSLKENSSDLKTFSASNKWLW